MRYTGASAADSCDPRQRIPENPPDILRLVGFLFSLAETEVTRPVAHADVVSVPPVPPDLPPGVRVPA